MKLVVSDLDQKESQMTSERDLYESVKCSTEAVVNVSWNLFRVSPLMLVLLTGKILCLISIITTAYNHAILQIFQVITGVEFNCIRQPCKAPVF